MQPSDRLEIVGDLWMESGDVVQESAR